MMMDRKSPPKRVTTFDWTDEVIANLRLLWTQGHSTSEIGRRLGASKNAIVGKAHRLELPGRQSPIIRDADPKPHRDRVPRNTLELFTSVAVVPRTPTAAAPRILESQAAVIPIRVPQSAPHRTTSLPAVPPFSIYKTCQFPSGTPGKSDFRFCGERTAPGRPYCQPCCNRAYVKVRDRDQDAAD